MPPAKKNGGERRQNFERIVEQNHPDHENQVVEAIVERPHLRMPNPTTIRLKVE